MIQIEKFSNFSLDSQWRIYESSDVTGAGQESLKLILPVSKSPRHRLEAREVAWRQQRGGSRCEKFRTRQTTAWEERIKAINPEKCRELRAVSGHGFNLKPDCHSSWLGAVKMLSSLSGRFHSILVNEPVAPDEGRSCLLVRFYIVLLQPARMKRRCLRTAEQSRAARVPLPISCCAACHPVPVKG